MWDEGNLYLTLHCHRRQNDSGSIKIGSGVGHFNVFVHRGEILIRTGNLVSAFGDSKSAICNLLKNMQNADSHIPTNGTQAKKTNKN